MLYRDNCNISTDSLLMHQRRVEIIRIGIYTYPTSPMLTQLGKKVPTTIGCGDLYCDRLDINLIQNKKITMPRNGTFHFPYNLNLYTPFNFQRRICICWG